ncbi:pyridoxal-phosphate dependent enzyme [bacterium]|nr:pyridoxal-phosphate dependent enzyme [bacterium]
MNHFKLICIDCNAAHKPSFELLRCSKCDGILDVEYSYSYIKEIRQNLSVNTLIELMTPVTEKDSIVSLGEGNTPCTAISTVSSDFNQTLIAKLEYMNPTGSFKDRGVATMISAAKHYGIKEIVEDSSGNAGASVAAYGAAAGIKSNIFVPSDAAGSKLAQISAYGAVVHKINGSRSDVTDKLINYKDKLDIHYASHAISPFFIEGNKTFAYELALHFKGDLPEHIIFPVGNGGLLLGAWKGLKELLLFGLIRKMPKLHSIQSELVDPITRAYNSDTSSPKNGVTMASGISVKSPPRLNQIVQVLNQTEGRAISITEKQMVDSRAFLAGKGLYCEYTSAVTLAGFIKLLEIGEIIPDQTILLPLTGTGLKEN